MKSINPMFQKQKSSSTDQQSTNNVRKTAKIDQPRKRRNDKKHDIRVPVSDAIKSYIKSESFEYDSVTQYCTHLVEKGLKAGVNFPPSHYVNYDDVVHVKVSQEMYKLIFDKQLEWDQRSIRQATHRILMGMLKAEGV
ncbi:hypothetical protein [Priestia koreensis]|uniref:hypothetical protein n=1 Tax=Priestia koreensis TaxID=284581 RepID=UPI001F58AB90|nr:hypothetical protein [Priestia koreensis]UNL87454.1 hypothetical protein IE339_24365 [Priestia koreensis]